MAHRSPPIAHRWPPLPTGGPPVATAKTVTATEVATDGTAVEDRWPPMDFPGLSTRAAQKRHNRLRKHQASVPASLGLARWHMQNMQTSEFTHLWGRSSGSAVSFDVFRGGWHHPAISGISLWLGVLSRAGWGCLGWFFEIPD